MEITDLIILMDSFLPDVLLDNWETIGVIAVAFTVIATAVAKLTKNTTDDRVMGVVSRVVQAVVKLPIGRKKA